MTARTYNKLVRDKVPDQFKTEGVKAHIHEADDKEFETALLEKLREELLEFKNNKSIEQLADLLDVVDELIRLEHWTPEQIAAVRQERLQEKGGFTKRYILESTE